MKRWMGSFVFLTATLWLSQPTAWADTGYRLIQLNDAGDHREVIVTDLNHRGEVVGSSSRGGGALAAFRWRNGEYLNLPEAVTSGSDFTQAAGINDLSTIVGFRSVPNFEGFLLRGTHVTPLRVVDGESNVFPNDINNRGQVLVDSFGGPQSGSFLLDRGRAELLPLVAVGLNDQGAVLGNTQTPDGNRAVLWRNGTITDLGVTAGADASFGRDINNRHQAVGFVSFPGGPAAFVWRNGTMTLLPPVPPTTARSTEAASINDFGVAVGQTTLLLSGGERIATLWLGERALDVNQLIRADDPLRPHVHLESAQEINNRGDIVATGVDSRQPAVQLTYFLTLFDE